jgi:hypothetical protein
VSPEDADDPSASRFKTPPPYGQNDTSKPPLPTPSTPTKKRQSPKSSTHISNPAFSPSSSSQPLSAATGINTSPRFRKVKDVTGILSDAVAQLTQKKQAEEEEKRAAELNRLDTLGAYQAELRKMMEAKWAPAPNAVTSYVIESLLPPDNPPFVKDPYMEKMGKYLVHTGNRQRNAAMLAHNRKRKLAMMNQSNQSSPSNNNGDEESYPSGSEHGSTASYYSSRTEAAPAYTNMSLSSTSSLSVGPLKTKPPPSLPAEAVKAIVDMPFNASWYPTSLLQPSFHSIYSDEGNIAKDGTKDGNTEGGEAKSDSEASHMATVLPTTAIIHTADGPKPTLNPYFAPLGGSSTSSNQADGESSGGFDNASTAAETLKAEQSLSSSAPYLQNLSSASSTSPSATTDSHQQLKDETLQLQHQNPDLKSVINSLPPLPPLAGWNQLGLGSSTVLYNTAMDTASQFQKLVETLPAHQHPHHPKPSKRGRKPSDMLAMGSGAGGLLTDEEGGEFGMANPFLDSTSPAKRKKTNAGGSSLTPKKEKKLREPKPPKEGKAPSKTPKEPRMPREPKTPRKSKKQKEPLQASTFLDAQLSPTPFTYGAEGSDSLAGELPSKRRRTRSAPQVSSSFSSPVFPASAYADENTDDVGMETEGMDTEMEMEMESGVVHPTPAKTPPKSASSGPSGLDLLAMIAGYETAAGGSTDSPASSATTTVAASTSTHGLASKKSRTVSSKMLSPPRTTARRSKFVGEAEVSGGDEDEEGYGYKYDEEGEEESGESGEQENGDTEVELSSDVDDEDREEEDADDGFLRGLGRGSQRRAATKKSTSRSSNNVGQVAKGKQQQKTSSNPKGGKTSTKESINDKKKSSSSPSVSFGTDGEPPDSPLSRYSRGNPKGGILTLDSMSPSSATGELRPPAVARRSTRKRTVTGGSLGGSD